MINGRAAEIGVMNRYEIQKDKNIFGEAEPPSGMYADEKVAYIYET